MLASDNDSGAGWCSLVTYSGLAPGSYTVVVRAYSFATPPTFEYTLQVDLGAIVCGDGRRSATEVCDGMDVGGETCISQGFASGVLRCAPGCTAFDTSMCLPPICGNSVKEGGEECDDGNTMPGDCCSGTCLVEAISEVSIAAMKATG